MGIVCKSLLILLGRHSAIVPHEDQFYQHEPGHSLEQKGIQDAPSPFFYQPDLVLYFWHVFLHSCGVDCKDRYKVSELLKLVVHQDCAHLKSSASV